MTRVSIHHCARCGDLVFLVAGLGRVCLAGCEGEGWVRAPAVPARDGWYQIIGTGAVQTSRAYYSFAMRQFLHKGYALGVLWWRPLESC